jgi:hypothetical protein
LTTVGRYPRIITFCDGFYIPVALNWLAALDRLGLTRHAIICTLDAAAQAALPSALTLFRPCPADCVGFEAKMAHRTEVIRHLVTQDQPIIHSDLDAVWLADPWPHIRACNAPLVFSQGTVWPPDVHRDLGFVLCNGLYFVQPTPMTQRILTTVASRVMTEGSDQAATNRVIMPMVRNWRINAPLGLPFRDTVLTTSRQPMQGLMTDETGDYAAIAILPHHQFPRLMTAMTPDVIVAHPLSDKSAPDKRASLGRLGLWFLPEAELVGPEGLEPPTKPL